MMRMMKSVSLQGYSRSLWLPNPKALPSTMPPSFCNWAGTSKVLGRSGTGIYPSHLQVCSCHRLLSHRSRSQTEEFLQLANDLQVTVFRYDCPGIIQEKGTEFNLSLLWQLKSNHHQLLKQRLVLIRPQYIFGDSESRLKIIYRGDNPGEFYAAMASRV